jgi:Tol biopolymer transport system component
VGARAVVLAVLVLSAWCAATANAAFPGANGKIAYIHYDPTAGWQIRTVNPDGSDVAQLTSVRDNFNPRWSANGRRLVFTSGRDGKPEIYVMDADGGNQTRLTSDPATDFNPSWSPDGQKIAFQRNVNGLYDIYVVGVDGSGTTNLTNGQGGAEPAWSPDGRKIAFISGNNVFSMNADGSGRTKLTAYPTPTHDSFAEPGNPNWSPDGDKIAYDLIFGGGLGYFFWSLNVINADGTAPVEYFFGIDAVARPAFAPDGTQIVFTCDEGVCLLPPPGEFAPVPLPGLDRFDSQPDWQPVVPAPVRSDFRNASRFCKAERDFLGDASFRQKYGGGANAHGMCVSSN